MEKNRQTSEEKKRGIFFSVSLPKTNIAQSHYFRAHSEFNFNGTFGGRTPAHQKGVTHRVSVVPLAPSIEQVSIFYFNAMGFPLLDESHPSQVYICLCNSAPSFVAFQDGVFSLFSASLNVSLASHFIPGFQLS